MATEAVNLNITKEGEQALLTWTPSETTNLLNWLVEKKVGAEGTWTKLPELESIKTSTSVPIGEGQTFFRVWAVVKQNAKEASITVSPPAAELKLALTADKTGVQIISAPAGSTVDFALCETSAGAKPLYEPKGQKVGAIVRGKPGHEWIDAQITGSAEWWSKAHSRIKVEVAHEEPPVEEPPVEKEPPVEPPKTGFKRGICAGGWTQSQEVTDVKKCGQNPVVRLENPGSTSPFSSAGIAVIYLSSGGTSTNVPHLTETAREHRSRIQLAGREFALLTQANERLGYNTGGVKALNTEAVVKNAVAVVKKHPDIWAFEYLNEPGGDWFWGSGANGSANSAAYAKQVRAIHEAFVKEFGSKAPPILVSFDGGHAGDNTWGRGVIAADSTLFALPLVIPTNHPYDGSGANPSSTLVRWGSVEETHRLTGKWPVISEYGRPLENGTGDSPKSSEAQQASADGAMVKKAREVGSPAVTIFGYRGGNYGVFASNDAAHPAVSAIANA